MENTTKAEKKILSGKIKFYDTNFKVLGTSLLIMIITMSLFPSMESIVLGCAIIIAISIISISWGMFYHQFRSGSYWWLSLTVLLFFIGSAPVSLMFFYWIKMRKEFKKGNGIYL